jgi:hypothetical protein
MASSRRHKFLAPELLDEATSELAEILEEQEACVALIGGYALQLYGSPRLTGDIDVASDRMILRLPKGKHLSFGGFQTTAPNGTPVDVVIRSDGYESLYEEAIVTAREMRDIDLPVALTEYLAAMKMIPNRGKDEADLEWLIMEKKIKIRKTRDIILRHLGRYAADEFDLTVDEAKWRASRR